MAKTPRELEEKFINEKQQSVSLYHNFQDYFTEKHFGLVISGDDVYGIGENSRGQLGVGNNENVDKFQKIPELCGKKIIEFIEGNSCMFARTQDCLMYGWGGNALGQLGRGYSNLLTEYLKPQEIQIGERITTVVCGEMHALALSVEGNVYAWGENSFSQIGCSSNQSVISTPIKITFPNKIEFKIIYCYLNSSTAITKNNELYFWGENMGYFSKLPRILSSPELIEDIKTNQIVLLHKRNKKDISKGFLYYLSNNMLFRYKKSLIDRDVDEIALDNNNQLIYMKKGDVYTLSNQKPEITACKSFEEYFIQKFGANFCTHRNFTNMPRSLSMQFDNQAGMQALGTPRTRSSLSTTDYRPDSTRLSTRLSTLSTHSIKTFAADSQLQIDFFGAVYSDQYLSRPTIKQTIFGTKDVEGIQTNLFEKLSSLVGVNHQAQFKIFLEALDKSSEEIKLYMNNLKESVNSFEMFCRQNFKTYHANMILFISVNFAFKMLIKNFLINSQSSVEGLKMFYAYIEFIFVELKYLKFSGKIEQCKELLDKTAMENSIRLFSINDQLYEFFRDIYILYENMVINDDLCLDDKEVPNQAQTEFDSDVIVALAEDSEIRFKSAAQAVFHWRKHSVEDLYETKLQKYGSAPISPKEYLREANDVLTSEDVNILKLDTNTNIWQFTVEIEEGDDYSAHQRNVEIKWGKSIELITYYKNKL